MSNSKKSSSPRKINKARGVQSCANMLSDGKNRTEILRFFTDSYGVSISTVEKWMKEARPVAQQRQQAAEQIRLREMEAAITDAVKEGLLSDTELELILCKIASAGVEVEEYIKGNPVIRGVLPSEQIAATKAIYLKRGSNAPAKIAATDKDGNDLKPMKITLNLT